jgi:hypothetical protein
MHDSGSILLVMLCLDLAIYTLPISFVAGRSNKIQMSTGVLYPCVSVAPTASLSFSGA